MIFDIINQQIKEKLKSPEIQQDIINEIILQFEKVKKRQRPDLIKQINNLKKQLKIMLNNIELVYEKNGIVFKVTGVAESVMKQLRFGSDWHAPWEKVDEIVLAAILMHIHK